MTIRQIGCFAVSVLGASFSMGCSSGGINPNDAGTSSGQTSVLWDGYAEAWSFGPDGSDRVRLTLDAMGNGAIQVGEGTLPPATDPDVEYPPGVTANGFESGTSLFEGYRYPTHASSVEGGRVQFGVNNYDVFSGWCALQTPAPLWATGIRPDGGVSGTPFYGCTPNVPNALSTGPSGAADGGAQCAFIGADGSILATIDCGKLFLCNTLMVCRCDASSCSSSTLPDGTIASRYPITFDGTVDSPPTTMTGTLAMNGTRVTVHLTRK